MLLKTLQGYVSFFGDTMSLFGQKSLNSAHCSLIVSSSPQPHMFYSE